MNKLLPILSTSLREIIDTIVKKADDPIAKELQYVDTIVNNINDVCYGIKEELEQSILDTIVNPLITDEVRMLSIRVGEFEVSFLPKGKTPEYGQRNTWLRHNRQTGKPARIFQKLLKKEFKTREWEIFTNLIKAELCECADFQLVEGEDIRYWYLDDNYYKCDGTLGNSCMRYEHAQPYFDIYVDNAKMLITTKDGLLTGRAIVWEIGDITLLDRIYTCFDYLENCFIDYAKEHKWWIRENNSLLSTGDDQGWLTPDDNYENVTYREFTITLKKTPEQFPYVDSFRYFDGDRIISTNSSYHCALDSTEGEWRGEVYTCANCGATYYGYDDETPEELHWSEYDDAYYCNDCCWYSDGLDDYISNNEASIDVIGRWSTSNYPESYVTDNLVETPDGTECSSDIVKIDNRYFFVSSNKITFNRETGRYEIRSDS